MAENRELSAAVELQRLEDIVDRHGSDPAAWPDTARHTAAEFATTAPEGRKLLADAARIEGYLSAPAGVAASPGLKARILAAAAEAGPRKPSWSVEFLWPFGPVWRPLTALSAAAVLGVVVGLADPENLPGIGERGPSGLDDMVILAYGAETGLEDPE